MNKIKLIGVDALNEPTRSTKKVLKFVDDKHRMSIQVFQNTCRLITLSGTYYLRKKSDQHNYFAGTCNGAHVKVDLAKITGWIGWT